MKRDTKAAYDLIAHLLRQGQPVAITPETADELDRMGIKPAPAQVMAIPPEAIVICPYVEPGMPLIMSNNRRARCAECRHPIQHRPHVPQGAKLVCSPCGLRMVRGDA